MQHFSPQQVLYEDNHLLIINKKVGQLVQGDQTGDLCLLDMLKTYLKEKYNKPGAVFLGLVHRIDRPTSGLVIYAKTSKALSRLTQMVKNRQIQKTYWAVVPVQANIATEQKLVHYLRKNAKNNKAQVFHKAQAETKEAILSYQIIKKSDNFQLLQVDLETGRHHQIRAQLSTIGAPIKGDLKYGAPRSNANGGIHLHARKLQFEHPVSKENISITAPVDSQDSVWRFFED